jgi:hypothetical protein
MKSVVICFVSFIVADASHNAQRALPRLNPDLRPWAQNLEINGQRGVDITCPNWPPHFYIPARKPIKPGPLVGINVFDSSEAFSRANPEVLPGSWVAMGSDNGAMECLKNGQMVARTLAKGYGTQINHEEAYLFCLYVKKYFMTNQQIILAQPRSR